MEKSIIQLKNEYKRFCERLEPNFVIDDNNKEVILQLFNYFTGTGEQFLDNKKGILLVGEVGCGKSLIMKAFSSFSNHNQLYNAYEYYAINEIQFDVNKLGYSGIELYTYNYIDNAWGVRNARYENICIDDLGTESEVVSYGNKINFVEEILQLRYDFFQNSNVITHATTNLSGVQIKEKYSERTFDRIKEMMTEVNLTGTSRRK